MQRVIGGVVVYGLAIYGACKILQKWREMMRGTK